MRRECLQASTLLKTFAKIVAKSRFCKRYCRIFRPSKLTFATAFAVFFRLPHFILLKYAGKSVCIGEPHVLNPQSSGKWQGMVERTYISPEGADTSSSNAASAASLAQAWFGREVLPLEASLMQYLEHNWRNASDITDLRQEVYVRVYTAALRKIPERPKHFVFATARNLLIDRVRHEQIIPIEAAADLEALDAAVDTPGPDRVIQARDELRRLQAALDRLTPRCREAVILGRIEGLSKAEIAVRMGIAEISVAQYLTEGIYALADILYGEPPNVRRKA